MKTTKNIMVILMTSMLALAATSCQKYDEMNHLPDYQVIDSPSKAEFVLSAVKTRADGTYTYYLYDNPQKINTDQGRQDYYLWAECEDLTNKTTCLKTACAYPDIYSEKVTTLVLKGNIAFEAQTVLTTGSSSGAVLTKVDEYTYNIGYAGQGGAYILATASNGDTRLVSVGTNEISDAFGFHSNTTLKVSSGDKQISATAFDPELLKDTDGTNVEIADKIVISDIWHEYFRYFDVYNTVGEITTEGEIEMEGENRAVNLIDFGKRTFKCSGQGRIIIPIYSRTLDGGMVANHPYKVFVLNVK